jgi:hypothetical protein
VALSRALDAGPLDEMSCVLGQGGEIEIVVPHFAHLASIPIRRTRTASASPLHDVALRAIRFFVARCQYVRRGALTSRASISA